jgi:hypothetical protein
MSSQMILRQISNLWSARDLFVDLWAGFLARMRVTLRIEYGIGYPRNVQQITRRRQGVALLKL